MTRTIDTHAHVIVPGLVRDAAPQETWRPHVYREPDRFDQTVEMGGREIRSSVREWVAVDRILADQDRAGTDVVTLSPLVSLLYGDADAADALARCRIQNDGIEAMVTAHPDRIAGLGAVPLQDPALAAAELRELMGRGVLRGVEIAASVRGTYLGDDCFEPFWAAAEETGALVFIHPTTRGFDDPVFTEHYLWNAVGNPLETTITAAHLVLTGTIERHPGLRILLAHGGGTILALRGRLRHAHSFQPQARSRLREDPEASLRRFYYDSVVHDAGLLRALVETVGADRVMLGSDHPFDMGDLRPADTVRAAGLDPRDEALVLEGNAAALLGLELTA
ncbi:amidohydrolase family protein [Conexibacter sp. CPCC 206217]|uniref:amidohydrolase family protein n=1 Tax=Conexibacter sp. CPCC 206217 TaxID=3064574 RepID=UPI002717AFA4|nr:amidohydrolase family protein [Conexibacter sp. CPCC 206217]MDO8212491.1 amidohydrolase family protein [Conexibacter sp. CPCC 206217]